MQDLFEQTDHDFRRRAISPLQELGAYEALWTGQSTTFKTIADIFRDHPNAIPSDFVDSASVRTAARKALGAIREANIGHFGIRVHGAGDYPAKLRDADHPIEVLYFQGAWELAASPAVAVVGSRTASAKGQQLAADMASGLVSDGFTVISGLARGIDTVSHRTAIDAGGRTIAVLGTPITEIYPKENEKLQREIADQFLVISQVPIIRYANGNVRTNARLFFPARNVTMSALSQATVIIEASDRSGTLHQARAALKQGRKLFITDHCFQDNSLTWPSRFEQRGAIRVADYSDIRRQLERNPISTD